MVDFEGNSKFIREEALTVLGLVLSGLAGIQGEVQSLKPADEQQDQILAKLNGQFESLTGVVEEGLDRVQFQGMDVGQIVNESVFDSGQNVSSFPKVEMW